MILGITNFGQVSIAVEGTHRLTLRGLARFARDARVAAPRLACVINQHASSSDDARHGDVSELFGRARHPCRWMSESS
jgi:hypothetical protein